MSYSLRIFVREKYKRMGVVELKNKIQASLEQANMDLLERVLEVIDTYQDGDDSSFLSEEQMTTLDQRLENHQMNPEVGRNWEEVKAELSAKYGV